MRGGIKKKKELAENYTRAIITRSTEKSSTGDLIFF